MFVYQIVLQDTVILFPGQRVDLVFNQKNKDNMSLQDTVWTGLLTAPFKRLRFPQLGHKPTLCIKKGEMDI